MNLSDKVSSIKGVGPKKEKILEQHGIFTIEDFISFYPRTYEDRRSETKIKDIESDNSYLISGKVLSRTFRGAPYKNKSPLRLLIEDETGILEVVFFNGKYLTKAFEVGEKYSFYGKISQRGGAYQMIHPDFASYLGKDDIRGILPIYPRIEGLSQKEIRKLQLSFMPLYDKIEEWLPEEIIKENKIADTAYALKHIHFPSGRQSLLAAKYRLIFEELLVLETGLSYIKKDSHKETGGIKIKALWDSEFLNRLPYKLTSGQEKVWKKVKEDLASEKVMNRLVQGDVGSGKTVIAELAMHAAFKEGFESVMMAPTELLAKQHFASLEKDFAPLGIKVGLLCSSMKAAEKRQVLTELEKGEIHVLVGTHAVIQPNVKFKNLGLVITDEQHRFGVNQRKLLSEKGENPNVLVMTATPIPRTLAVILYADLDISIIDTMPVGRKPIETHSATKKERGKVYRFVLEEINKGHQAYVVAPLIEESENVEAKSAKELYAELTKVFQGKKVALIHGSLKQEEKDLVMEEFAAGKIQVLVSTVVIEVGINVANATVMVIENSERFGLAQMHQLRGRVGRSDAKSYCFLICEKDTEVAKKRVETMCKSSDGFFIAEEDLRLRGPGEIFGTRQHGIPELKLSDLFRHVKVLEQAKDIAETIIKKDENLSNSENAELRRRVEKMFGKSINLQL